MTSTASSSSCRSGRRLPAADTALARQRRGVPKGTTETALSVRVHGPQSYDVAFYWEDGTFIGEDRLLRRWRQGDGRGQRAERARPIAGMPLNAGRCSNTPARNPTPRATKSDPNRPASPSQRQARSFQPSAMPPKAAVVHGTPDDREDNRMARIEIIDTDASSICDHGFCGFKDARRRGISGKRGG